MSPPPPSSPQDDTSEDDSVTIIGEQQQKQQQEQQPAGAQKQEDDCESVNLLEDDSARSACLTMCPIPAQETPPSFKLSSQESRNIRDRRQGQWKSSPASSFSSPFVSPATQTLNVLSQNMDDLRYNMNASLQTEQEEKKSSAVTSSTTERQVKTNRSGILKTSTTNPKTKDDKLVSTPNNDTTTTTVTTTSTTDNKNNASHAKGVSDTSKRRDDIVVSAKESHRLVWNNYYQQRYQQVPLCIKETEGVLGIVLQRACFFGTSSQQHCKVLRVLEPSLAQKHGFLPGDWICHRGGTTAPAATASTATAPHTTSDENSIVLADFDQVILWSKHRPFSILALRQQEQQQQQRQQEKPKTCIALPTVQKEKDTKAPPSATAKIASDSSNRTKKNKNSSSDEKKKMTTTTTTTPKKDPQKAPKTRNAPEPTMIGTTTTTKKKKKTNAHGSKGTESHSSRSLKTSRTSQPKAGIRNCPTNNKHKAKVDQEKGHPPFCLRCNHKGKNPPRMHHAWCPQNKFFDNSGAKELMIRMRQGRRLGCQACETEYTTGKLTTKQHKLACTKNQKRLQTIAVEEEEERKRNQKRNQNQNRNKEQDKSTKPKKRKQPKKHIKGAGNKTRVSKAILSTSSFTSLSSSSSGDEEDMDEISVYQPQKKKSRIQTISFIDKGSPSSDKKGRRVDSRGEERNKSRVITPQPRSTPPPPLQDDSLQDLTSNKPKWVRSFENPWGKPGYAIGDVLLYAPTNALSHFETMLPSKRYIFDPFAPSSSYRATHCTPEEGYTMLSLRRDPLASRPWGFQVCFDEFGNACLVESIDSMSPAAAASLVGMPESQTSSPGLRVNDMLVMVNGKVVGGMTQVGVEMEIETSGPTLLLAISRYKHANDAARKFAEMERKMLRVMDSAARDNRLLGWLEIGNADSPPSPPNRPREHRETSDLSDDFGSRVLETPLKKNMPQASVLSYDKPRAEEERGISYEEPLEDTGENNSTSCSSAVSQSESTLEKSYHLDPQKSSYSSGSEMDERRHIRIEDEELSPRAEDWDDDENAWLGCVCGKIHKKSEHPNLFWIQCESCSSWYDVSQKCVGFGMQEAKTIENWTCWACPEIDLEEQSSSPKEAPKRTSQDGVVEIEKTDAPQNGLELSTCTSQISNGKEAVNVGQGNTRNDVDSETNFSLKDKVQDQTEREKRAENFKARTTDEGFLLPNSKPFQRDDGTFSRPPGNVPSKMAWDKYRGLWIPLSLLAKSQDEATSIEDPRNEKKAVNENKSRGHSEHSTRSRRRVRNDADSGPSNGIGNGDMNVVFQRGDLVFVEPHAWPGVNCIGGIGHVVDSHVDNDGERLYHIKYVLGWADKDVEAEYVSQYSFE